MTSLLLSCSDLVFVQEVLAQIIILLTPYSKLIYNKLAYEMGCFMWTRTYSKTYQGIKRDSIWRLWTDVNNWPAWHGDLDSCTLNGAFEVGNYFMLKPQGMRAVKIDLIEINQGKSFTDCTNFFGAKMIDTHELEETKEGLKLTNKLVVTGPLKWLWIKLVAQHVADSVPDEMEALVSLAKGSS
jgi:hypothetical protein